jgi:hypothetical protein
VVENIRVMRHVIKDIEHEAIVWLLILKENPTCTSRRLRSCEKFAWFLHQVSRINITSGLDGGDDQCRSSNISADQ